MILISVADMVAWIGLVAAALSVAAIIVLVGALAWIEYDR